MVLRVITEACPGDAAHNMAVDEVLLLQVECPVLRHYGWTVPAVSFGYFDKYAAICTLFPKRQKVRRWTGGGIVLHGEDFTFSLVLPRRVMAQGEDSSALYAWIHQSVVTTLKSEGWEVELAGGEGNPAGVDCFTNPVRADVLLDGRKVVGGALRRTRSGVLYQGSIQGVPVGERFLSKLAEVLVEDGSLSELRWDGLTDGEICQAESLAEAKYATPAWNEKF